MVRRTPFYVIETGERFESLQEGAVALGGSRSSAGLIGAMLNKKHYAPKTFKGFTFSYENPKIAKPALAKTIEDYFDIPVKKTPVSSYYSAAMEDGYFDESGKYVFYNLRQKSLYGKPYPASGEIYIDPIMQANCTDDIRKTLLKLMSEHLRESTRLFPEAGWEVVTQVPRDDHYIFSWKLVY